MGPNTQANGLRATMRSATGTELRCGPTVHGTKATGRTIKPAARENFYTFMAICMMETGWTIRPTVKESTRMRTAPGMKAAGKTIFRMVKASRPG